MALVKLVNSYSTTISVAFMRFDPACGADCGDSWTVLGWINLEAGQTGFADNPTGNQFFYYYGEAVDGAFWAGNFVAEVENPRFEKCTCLGVSVSDGPNPWYDVGMRELDLGQFGGVNFTP